MPFYRPLHGRRAAEVPEAVRERTARNLLRLKDALRQEIPGHSIDQRALIATWNIRELDSTKGGRRGVEPLMYIAEIISAFDLVAVQEVVDDLSALNTLLGYLGSWWDVLISDVTRGQSGNKERLAFLYDSRKVRFGGLVGEVVRPDPRGHPDGVFVQQFARTPFLVGFQVGWQKFTICTAHIYYGEGEDDQRRIAEVGWLAQHLADQSQERHAWAQNVLMLGDFNIFKADESAVQAIRAAGFVIPDELKVRHTDLGDAKHYDQIAWLEHPKPVPGAPARYPIRLTRSGVFRWDDVVYRRADADTYRSSMGTWKDYNQWRTYQLSDHRPMWVELTTDFSREYLTALAGDGAKPDEEAVAPAILPNPG
jgi:endonuclease/exonuclease/phosphatase family metal-dependent hydrolase